MIVLPPSLNVREFAVLIRRSEEFVRRKVREGVIKSDGHSPMQIPSGELRKLNLDLDHCAAYYALKFS